MEDSFGWFGILFIGVFSIIRFRQLADFTHKQSKGMTAPIPDKWDIVFLQIGYLVVGFVFVIVSFIKLVGIYF